MNIISYVLYGKNIIYNKGALINAKMAKQYYPNFKVWIYISAIEDIIEEYYLILKDMDNVKLIIMNDIDKSIGCTIWRYIPAFTEEKLNILIVRDLDSLLNNKRDLWAVKQWINSNCDFHIIRDCTAHAKIHIMGGIFGVKKQLLLPFKQEFNNFLNSLKRESNTSILSNNVINKLFNNFNEGNRHKNIDQGFLKNFIYNKVINKSLIHFSEDSIKIYPCKKGLINSDITLCKSYEIIPKHIIDSPIGSRAYKQINKY